MKPFRMMGVLRARKAQEDVAKAAAARARGDADAATAEVRRREVNLDRRVIPSPANATAFAAAVWARQALAGALGDAMGAAEAADATARTRRDELAAAAVRRRALEHLEERHTQAQEVAERSQEQSALDETASNSHQRREDPE